MHIATTIHVLIVHKLIQTIRSGNVVSQQQLLNNRVYTCFFPVITHMYKTKSSQTFLPFAILEVDQKQMTRRSIAGSPASVRRQVSGRDSGIVTAARSISCNREISRQSHSRETKRRRHSRESSR